MKLIRIRRRRWACGIHGRRQHEQKQRKTGDRFHAGDYGTDARDVHGRNVTNGVTGIQD
jgi:hypothetical protein